jgi:hypothetical protein
MVEVDHQEEENFSLGDLLATLVDLRTLPHVILLVLLSAILYVMAQGSETGTAYSAVGFLSLSMAYALTAYLTRYDSVYRFVRVDGLAEGSFFQSLMLRSLRAWSLPLGLTLGLGICLTIVLNSDERMVKLLPLGLASLFLIWSAGQAISFRSGTGAYLAGKEGARDTSQREGGLNSLITAQMLAVGGFSVLMAVVFGYATKSGSEIGFGTHLTWVSFVIFSLAIQGGMFYLLREMLEGVSATNGGARFALTWGIVSQLFVTWHLTSAWRRLFEEPSAGAMILEEAVLMAMTVILAIWALSSRSVKRGGKMFTTENALFWGLSFGFGYAGSIAMITRITDLFAEGSLATTMGVGHLVTAVTLLAIHKVTLSNHANRMTEPMEQAGEDDVSDDADSDSGDDEEAAETIEVEVNEGASADDEDGFDDLDDLDIPEPVLE